MQGRRILIFLVVFLITLPIVTAAADGVDKGVNDGFIIQLGSLHEGERFVYDLHLTSTYRDLDIRVPEFYQVEIDRIRDFRTLDGAQHDVVATTMKSKPAPWGHNEQNLQVSNNNRTEYVRVDDGVYLERLEERHRASWTMTENHTSRTVWKDALRIEGEGNGGNVYNRGIRPDTTFVNGNLVQKVVMAVVMGVNEHIDVTGEWQGEKVYDVSGRHYTTTSAGTSFRCQTMHPEIHYDDPESREAMSGRVLQEDFIQRTWVRPGLAYPVVDECHSFYLEGDEFVEDLHLVLELTDYQPGGAEIPVRWDRTNTRPNYQPEGTMEAQPTTHAGAPEGGDSLGVSLTDALDVVTASDDAALQTWMDDDPQPFWVVEAHYQPRFQGPPGAPVAPPPGPLPNPTPIPLPPPGLPDPTAPDPEEEPSAPDEERVGIDWSVLLANRAGETRWAHVSFNETSPGVFDDGAMEAGGGERPEDALMDGRLPDALVPLDQLIDRFVSDAGLHPDQWLDERGPYLILRNTIIDDGGGDYRAFHELRLSTNDPDADPDNDNATRQVTRTYDTRTGAPLVSGHMEGHTVEGASPPAEPSYAPASGDAPAPVARFPAAATASGFALAVGFAVAFFWDGVTRAAGQFILAPLYAKIRKDKVLDHKTRERIVDHVSQTPGIAVEDLRREMAIGYGTMCHHLDTLQRNGLVTSHKVGRRRCYFLPGTMDPDDMVGLGASGTEAASRFLDIVTKEPGLSQREVAARLGVADSSVRYQAKRLLAHERLRAEREGRTVRYYPNQDHAPA